MKAIHMSHSTTARSTIQALRKMFATHGLPAELVSNNGPPFTSEEFATFMKQNGIRHIQSPPFHPATNGLTEWAVQSFKSGIKNQPYTPHSTSWQHDFYITEQLRTPPQDNHHASSSSATLFAHNLLSCIHLQLKRFPNGRMLRKYAMTSITRYAHSQWEIQSWCVITELKSQSGAHVLLHRF